MHTTAADSAGVLMLIPEKFMELIYAFRTSKFGSWVG
jgi:hypothetical protein